MLVVAIPVFVVEAVHGHFVGLPAGDTGHHLLATPDDALHRGAGSQLHEAADNVLKEGTWTHGAKKSPAGGALYCSKLVQKTLYLIQGLFLSCPSFNEIGIIMSDEYDYSLIR
jgi:hypothetical protein